MLQLPVIEFFIRLLPEAFILIFAAHAFSKSLVNKKRYIIASVVFGILNYIIRLLPIDYGIHSVLGLICYVIIIVNINKVNTIKSIQVVFISTITMFICEGINIGIIKFVFQKDPNVIFQDSILKTIYGLPSLLIFASIVGAYYYRAYKRNELKDV